MQMVTVAYDVAFELVLALRPIVEDLMSRDAALAERLQSASTSAMLRLAQPRQPDARSQRFALESAHGEAREALHYLDAAVARGLLQKSTPAHETCQRLVRLCWSAPD